MAVRRDIFFITTDAGVEADRRQVALAARTQRVPEGEADLFGIETFVHSYDPEQARAWIERAADPIIGGVAASRLPLDENAAPARTPKHKRDVLALLGVTEGMAQSEALRRVASLGASLVSDPVRLTPFQMVDVETLRQRIALKPASWRASIEALAAWEPWERIAAQIDRLPIGEQDRVVQEQLVGIQKFLRAVNVCYPAVLGIRRMAERLWGYYAYDSDLYMRGTSSQLIHARLQASQPAPYVNGQWRETLAAWERGYYHSNQWNGGLTLFGWETNIDEGSRPVGCRKSDPNANIIFPNNCIAPTGEFHRVWFQGDATLYNGDRPPPSWSYLAGDTRRDDSANDRGELDRQGVKWRVPDGVRQMGWCAPIFLYATAIFTPWRLYATPPLEWYWRMYFAPQPEFGGRTFAEWVMAQTAQEFIRTARRENTQRNQRTAGVFNTLVESLAGTAATQAARDHLQQERRNLANEQAVATIGGGAAATLTATGAGAVAGLVIGVATAATVGLLRALQDATPEVRIDVFGAMCPVFSQFSIYGDKARFSAVSSQQVGMPPRVSTPTSLALAVAALPPVMLGEVRIEGMPHYGHVFVDGERTDDSASRWADETLTTWVVPMSFGSHRVTIQRQEGGLGHTALVQVGATPLTLRYAEMQPELALQEVPAEGRTTGAKTSTGLSTGAKVGLVFALAALAGGAAWTFRRPKRNRRRR